MLLPLRPPQAESLSFPSDSNQKPILSPTIDENLKEKAFPKSSWRLTDLMVASTLAVIYGFMFVGFSYLFGILKPLLTILFSLINLAPLGQEVLIGFWFGAGIFVPFLVRRKGAAFLGAAVAALVEMPLVPWGFSSLTMGILQGLASELPFFLTRYRRYRWPVLLTASALPAFASFAYEYVPYRYNTFPVRVQLLMIGTRLLSGLLLGGFLPIKLGQAVMKAIQGIGEESSALVKPISPLWEKIQQENFDQFNSSGIQMNQVHVRYLNRAEPALDGIDLQVAEGETVLLLGPSGCGKSTLALCVNGLIPQRIPCYFSGNIWVAGASTSTVDFSFLAKTVGFLFQDPESHLTAEIVEQEIAWGLENIGISTSEIETRIESSLAQVGLSSRRKDRTQVLSLGEKQRLVLAAILAMRPRYLILDEPTAFLDSMGTKDILAILENQKKQFGMTLIIIEHKLDEVLPLIDQVVVMSHQGKIQLQGSPASIFGTNAEQLQKMGVFIPKTSELVQSLKQQNILLPFFPLTLEEAERAFLTCSTKPKAHLPSEKVSLSKQKLKADKPPILKVHNLSYRKDERLILDQISLQIAAGDFFALIGQNGAGKTSFIRHLISDLTPPAKTVWFQGKDIHTCSKQTLSKRIGVVFQNPEHQFLQNTVEDEILLSFRLHSIEQKEAHHRCEKMLHQFNLDAVRRCSPFSLSQGQKRRLSLATMISLNQELLILDEPTVGLDQNNIRELMSYLQTLHRQGTTIIFITHDLSLVAEYATIAGVLANGQLLYCGAVAELFTEVDLLARTNLTLPPLAELSHRLAQTDSRWQGLWTLPAWNQAYSQGTELKGSL